MSPSQVKERTSCCKRWSASRGKERGAALVELAIVLPILFLIIFAAVEFGWAFYQQTDVRHGARETSRLVAVNYKASSIPSACSSESTDGAKQSCALVLDACGRMDEGGTTSVTITSSTKSVGSVATITVSKPLDTITGFLDVFLGGKTLQSSVDTRLELNGTWVNYTRTCP